MKIRKKRNVYGCMSKSPNGYYLLLSTKKDRCEDYGFEEINEINPYPLFSRTLATMLHKIFYGSKGYDLNLGNTIFYGKITITIITAKDTRDLFLKVSDNDSVMGFVRDLEFIISPNELYEIQVNPEFTRATFFKVLYDPEGETSMDDARRVAAYKSKNYGLRSRPLNYSFDRRK